MDRIKWPSIPYADEFNEAGNYVSGFWVVTEKMDGENTTMTREFIHARSVDSADHPSRHYVKGIWAGIRHRIPEGLYLVGENLYAVHSIFYEDLPSYFLGFAVHNGRDVLAWDETCEIFSNLGLATVPRFDLSTDRSVYGPEREGRVVRNARRFPLKDVAKNMYKIVRPNHVQTDEHWMRQTVVANGLRRDR